MSLHPIKDDRPTLDNVWEGLNDEDFREKEAVAKKGFFKRNARFLFTSALDITIICLLIASLVKS